MGEAYRCDTCNAYDDGKPVMRVTLEPVGGTTGSKKKELCPLCLSELWAFLDGDDTEDGEGAEHA